MTILIFGKLLVALTVVGTVVVLHSILKHWGTDHDSNDDRCVSCGQHSREDFCEFCLREE